MKFTFNKKYTTISIYAIIVFFICIIIYKMVMSWTDSMAFIGNIIGILSPFLLGMLIAYFMNPMVRSFENKIIPKFKIGKLKIRSRKARLIWSIFLSYMVFTSLTVVLLAIIIPQVTNSVVDFSNDLPNYVDNLTTRLNQITFSIGNSP
jgi:predicted PurR-regulated permease PerM